MMALIIVVLLVVIFFQWQYIADLRWWKRYLGRRRDDAEEMNRKLIEKFTGIRLGDDAPDEESDGDKLAM